MRFIMRFVSFILLTVAFTTGCGDTYCFFNEAKKNTDTGTGNSDTDETAATDDTETEDSDSNDTAVTDDTAETEDSDSNDTADINDTTEDTYEKFCAGSFTILTGASAPSERVETEVVGLPYLEYDTPISNNITQGDSATVRMKITALCGDIRIEGFVALVVWSDNEYDWLVDLGQNQTPAELKNTATDSSDQDESWVGTYVPNTNSWPWNFLSYEGFFAEDAVEYIDSYTIEEGESVTYEFTFKDSAWIPVGDKFNMNFAYLFWTDLDGSDEPLVASTSPSYMLDGGLEWTGEEMYGRSSGTFPSVNFNIVE